MNCSGFVRLFRFKPLNSGHIHYRNMSTVVLVFMLVERPNVYDFLRRFFFLHTHIALALYLYLSLSHHHWLFSSCHSFYSFIGSYSRVHFFGLVFVQRHILVWCFFFLVQLSAFRITFLYSIELENTKSIIIIIIIKRNGVKKKIAWKRKKKNTCT